MPARKQKPMDRVAPEAALEAGAALTETSAAIALAARAAVPSPRVKEQLLARVRASRAPVIQGWRFAPVAENEGWVRLPFPGVKIRQITHDAERDLDLLYVEM